MRGRGALLSSQKFAVTVNAAGMLAFNRFKCWGGPAGLERGAVFADGSCYYRALYVVLVDIGREDCGQDGARMLRARMAQYLEDHCLDQMPGSDDTLMERSLVVAQSDWPRPPADFGELLRRARAQEWADAFFVQAPQQE